MAGEIAGDSGVLIGSGVIGWPLKEARKRVSIITSASRSCFVFANSFCAIANAPAGTIFGLSTFCCSCLYFCSKRFLTGTTALKASEGVAEGSEFDPLGLLVAGIGAIAATLIGRAVKTHTPVNVAPPPISSSYASTLGA